MTRRFLLLGALGCSLAGCGGSSEPDAVLPWVELDWGVGNGLNRTTPARPLITLPAGTKSVVLTFVGASVKSPGSDVVLRATRPASSHSTVDGFDYYGFSTIKGEEPIRPGKTTVRIDCYETADATGRIQRTTSVDTPDRSGRFFGLSSTFAVVREKVKRIRLEVYGQDKVTIPVGTYVPITLKYTYPDSVSQTYAPDFNELNFIFSGDHAPDGQLIVIDLPENSRDGSGNQKITIVGRGAGTVMMSILVDGVKSNTLTVEIIPTP